MKRKYITMAIISTIIVGSTIGFSILKKNTTNTAVTKAEYYKIGSVEKVFINGILTPKESEDIYVDATKGEIKEVHVVDGQVVSAGEKLFTYNNETIESQIEQLDLEITTNERTKQSLNKKSKTASDNLYKKQCELEDLKNQLTKSDNKQAISENENIIEETIESDIEDSVNSNINTIIQRAEAEVKVYSEEVTAYKEKIENIDLTLNTLKKQKNKLNEEKTFTVTAPISGVVVLSQDKNNYTIPYIIIESQELIVSGTVSEKDYEKIKLDDEVNVNIVSSNKMVDGKLSYISDRPISMSELSMLQSSTTNTNTSYYEVNITLNSQENLISGFHSQGKITLGDDTIKVPKTAIVKEEDNNYLFVDNEGILDKVEVKIGQEEGDYIIIESGIKENDKVLKNPTSDTKEGIEIE